MDLQSVRLLLDFGLMVLIWIVQLVIYPGLCYYKSEDLGNWHKIYTGRIGIDCRSADDRPARGSDTSVLAGSEYIYLGKFVGHFDDLDTDFSDLRSAA